MSKIESEISTPFFSFLQEEAAHVLSKSAPGLQVPRLNHTGWENKKKAAGLSERAHLTRLSYDCSLNSKRWLWMSHCFVLRRENFLFIVTHNTEWTVPKWLFSTEIKQNQKFHWGWWDSQGIHHHLSAAFQHWEKLLGTHQGLSHTKGSVRPSWTNPTTEDPCMLVWLECNPNLLCLNLCLSFSLSLSLFFFFLFLAPLV
jgi:hypothetical protein